MGQKTNPIGLRLGIIKQWEANWFDEKNLSVKLSEDIKVRNYIRSRLKKSGVSRLILERTAKQLRITINTSRPGVIIGRSGKDITQLEEEINPCSLRIDAIPNFRLEKSISTCLCLAFPAFLI